MQEGAWSQLLMTVCAGGGVVTVTDDWVCVQEGAWSQ